MPFNTPLTKSENLVLGRGICYFAPFDAAGRPMGERDLGEVSELIIQVEAESESFYSFRTATRKKIKEWVTAVDFGSNFTINDMSAANLALVMAGTSSTVAQSATPITNERIYNAESGREYQLGASSSNPSGVRNVGSVSVFLHELKNAVARADSTAYAVGDIFKSTTNVFLVTTAGTSAASPPTFDVTDVGDPTTDGTAVVKFLGTTAAFTVVTHYTLSAEAARVAIVPAANMGLACDLYTEVTDGYLSLSANYTPVAESRGRVTTSGAGSITGQFRFIADNSEGDNRDVFIPSCKLSPAGELPFITENETAAVQMRLGINEKDSSTAQIYVDERSPA